MRRAVWLLLLVGCDSKNLSSSQDLAMPPMPDLAAVSESQACADFSKALCMELQTCGAPLIKIAYGDEATCETRLNLTCTKVFHDPGTTLTPNELDACAQKLMTINCTQAAARQLPDECRTMPGTLVDGTACGDSGQCLSGKCKKPTGMVCGVCGKAAASGMACSIDDDCDFGLLCAANACVAPGALNATCDTAHPCGYQLVCGGGTCKQAPGPGMACTPDANGGNCDKTQGLFCAPISNLCQSAQYAAAGMPCGVQGSNFVLCTGSAKCSASGLMSGTCQAAAADGAACDATKGPLCMPPANCINSLCTLPDTTTCK